MTGTQKEMLKYTFVALLLHHKTFWCSKHPFRNKYIRFPNINLPERSSWVRTSAARLGLFWTTCCDTVTVFLRKKRNRYLLQAVTALKGRGRWRKWCQPFTWGGVNGLKKGHTYIWAKSFRCWRAAVFLIFTDKKAGTNRENKTYFHHKETSEGCSPLKKRK